MSAIKRILVPIDFSATSEAALEHAITMARRFGALLHVLHVVDDPFVSRGFGAHVPMATVPAMQVELVDEAASRLARLLPQCACAGVRCEIRVGRPAEVIQEVAEEQGSELIVMGAQGAGAVGRPRLGSTAEAVIAQARCPVLTVRGEMGRFAAGAHVERDHQAVAVR